MVEKKKEEFNINTDDKDLMVMVDYITDPFTELDNKNKFKVFTLEASRGKTIGSIRATIDDIKAYGAYGKRITFVSKFREECIGFVAKVNEETNNSYALAYMPSATKEDMEKNSNITNNFDKCMSKKIIAITHEMYMQLCLQRTERHTEMKEKLEKNFNTLIIDEQIDNVNSTYATFNILDYNQVLNIFKPHPMIKNAYKKICQPLIDLMENNTFNDNYIHRAKYTNEFEEVDYNVDKECETINAFIDGNVADESLEDYGIDSNYITTKSELKKFIQDISLFYYELDNSNVLVNSEYKSLFTYYSEFKFIKLQNNIWLDASAKFNSMYTLNKEFFDVVDSERIIDHSNCKFHYHRENTSKSFKVKNDITEFRKAKIKYIIKHTKKNSKVLILTSKTEGIQIKRKHLTEEFINEFEEYEILNFDNMRGVNTCKDYNYCYIIQTPRRQIPYYIFLYEYWKGKKLTDNEMQTNKINGNEDWGFLYHKELQQLLTDDIASSLYQGCKRIARSPEPVGYFHVFSKVDGAVKTTIEQFYNLPHPNKDGKITDYNNSKRKKSSVKGKIIKWLKSFEGVFRLNDILEKFKVSKSNWDYINRDSEVKKIKQERNIVCKKIKGKGKDYYLYIEA